MKNIRNIWSVMVAMATVAISLSSCSMETPFSEETGSLVRFDVSVNSALTRADISDDAEKNLLDKCVISVYNNVGLIYKWNGFSEVPSEGVFLKYGSYYASAVSGDSTAASFTSKYFKGDNNFNISDHATRQIGIVCKIANVVTSVDSESINNSIINDVQVKVSSTTGNLTFTGDRLKEKGYFMMSDGDNELSYTVTGKDALGRPITKSGKIPGVLPAHEYRFKFKFDRKPESDPEGGVIFDIEVEEYSLLQESDVVIYGKPSFSWSEGHQPGEQIKKTGGTFDSYTLRASAYKGFESLTMESSDAEIISKMGGSPFDLMTADSTNGIIVTNEEDSGIASYDITFTKDWLNSLADSEVEYKIKVTAKDLTDNSKSNSIEIRIANTSAAEEKEDPVYFDLNFTSDYMAVSPYSVSIPMTVSDTNTYEDLVILYKEESESDWMSQKIANTRGATTYVTLKNLKPGKKYLYKFAGGSNGSGSYEYESKTGDFTTENVYEIPNARMEDWWKDGDVWKPMQEGDTQYWDSGNHGSALMKKTLTEGVEFKGGQGKSAQLTSQFVALAGSLGKFAAGNIFFGEYIRNVGTSGAELYFGRRFNGSHPRALKLKVNCRLGEIDQYNSSTPDASIKKGVMDQAQIFVAIASEAFHINTADKIYFDPNADIILGYGEKTFTEGVGGDNDLVEITIPIDYYERAHSVKATHLIIVCSASKYGDFFTGSTGSRLVLDDFELVYD